MPVLLPAEPLVEALTDEPDLGKSIGRRYRLIPAVSPLGYREHVPPLEAEAQGDVTLPKGLLVKVLNDTADPAFVLVQWSAEHKGWVHRYALSGRSSLIKCTRAEPFLAHVAHLRRCPLFDIEDKRARGIGRGPAGDWVHGPNFDFWHLE